MPEKQADAGQGFLESGRTATAGKYLLPTEFPACKGVWSKPQDLWIDGDRIAVNPILPWVCTRLLSHTIER